MVGVCDPAIQLTPRSDKHFPLTKPQASTPPTPFSHRISISSWFHKHYKWDSMGATDCLSLVFFYSPPSLPLSLSLSLPLSLSLLFLFTVARLVSRDGVARETRPQTGPLRQRSLKQSTAMLRSTLSTLTLQIVGKQWNRCNVSYLQIKQLALN